MCYVMHMAGRGRGSNAGNKGGSNTRGLYAKNYPISVRDKLECDYLHKLTPEQREWLARANDAIAGASSTALEALGASPELRRQLYSEKNSANRDLYGNVKGRKRLHSLDEPGGVDIADSPTRDNSPPPGYLESAEYKAALREYREAIDRKDPEAIEAARFNLRWSGGK